MKGDLFGKDSNVDRSTTIEPPSAKNLHGIREETHHSDFLRSAKVSPSHSLDPRLHSRLGSMPRTVHNFTKHKKPTLYLNPLKSTSAYDDALARSLNILQAYGEILPSLG